jgi:UDP-N-acetylmuramate dehydrogenase
MHILENYSLLPENSFKIDVKARYFVKVSSVDDIIEVIKNPLFKELKLHILGGGTNTLFTADFPGLIIKVDIKGISVIKDDEESVILNVGAGENWNGFVQYAINNGYAGIENMSLIPGTVGAAPVQNIAAYGHNFEDVFVSLKALNLSTLKLESFDKERCMFGYRESYFKHEGKGKYIVTEVSVKLSKDLMIDTSYHSRYDSIIGELQQFTNPPYNVRDVSKAVIRIREKKFPDWEKIGTAGSFFLNPVITKDKLVELQEKVPNIQFYPVDKLTYPTPNDPTFDHANHVKVAAGWMLDELGWKGKKIGKVSTSPNQALVVINNGGATAKDIMNYTKKMQEQFKQVYNIELEPEVNII